MVCVICILCLIHLCCAQMHFKYAHKGENESEKFEIGVVLARQFLGKGPWEVWDLRPGCEKWCKSCSSSEERLVRHNGGRCPKALTRRQLGDQRAASTQKAIAERACLDNLQSASALAAELEDKRDDQIDQVGASPARPVPEKGASSGEEEARESGCSDARTGGKWMRLLAARKKLAAARGGLVILVARKRFAARGGLLISRRCMIGSFSNT